jgi:hypothetical protein
MKKIMLLFILTSLSSCGFAQPVPIDSLQKELASAKEDTKKIKLFPVFLLLFASTQKL